MSTKATKPVFGLQLRTHTLFRVAGNRFASAQDQQLLESLGIAIEQPGVVETHG